MVKKYFGLLFFILVLISTTALAQESNPWSRSDEAKIAKSGIRKKTPVKKYQSYTLRKEELSGLLQMAPAEKTPLQKSEFLLPFPDKEGKMTVYRVKEASVMHPDLAKQYPDNRSFTGVAVDDPYQRIRFSMNEVGLHAMITRADRSVQYIDPITEDQLHYRVYDRKDLEGETDFQCLLSTTEEELKTEANKLANDKRLRTYRLAIAATGEYSQFHIAANGAGNRTPAQQKAVVLAAITTAMTRVNAVFENDLAMTMQLVPNNADLIFLDPNTDPYTNDDGSAMLDENQTTCDQVLGPGNYDIGHVFSTGGGGVASLGGACNVGFKARGVTGSVFPVGDNFYFDFVAHEMGHQFGANHTFNGTDGNCAGDNRNDATAVEPGSGSTLMAYAGLCGSQNIQSHSDLYFHIVSIEEIWTNVTSGTSTCAETSALTTNRNVPVASAGPDFTIPAGTPYALKGSGSDADNDPITFNWEQVDNQITAVPPSGTSTGGALYRSFEPSTEPIRYMPQMSTLINGEISSTWEVTPLVSRQMNFKLTVRDNNPEAGQVTSDALRVTVTDAAGPFVVTSQATAGLVWKENSTETITWNVAGTTGNGIGVSRVNIRLSTDGGKTFTTVLASNTPNDGSQNITVPNIKASRCYIMVEAVGNFFFALNQQYFSIGEFNEVCNSIPATDTPIDIPDNNPAGITSTINIPEDYSVEKVRVHLESLVHPYLGDLEISLESPAGTVVELLAGACDSSNDIGDAIFDDEGNDLSCRFSSPAITGVVKPVQPLSALVGESAQGDWKLKVVDGGLADLGELVSWSLELCTSEPVLGVNNYVFDDFKVFPNPSNGLFRLQFRSENTEDVEISVYDVLGRKMMADTYTSQAQYFEQDLDLQHLSGGLYILRAKRGNRISSYKLRIK